MKTLVLAVALALTGCATTQTLASLPPCGTKSLGGTRAGDGSHPHYVHPCSMTASTTDPRTPPVSLDSAFKR